MKNALISVIVPVYNIERYIGICLETILHQTYSNLEIIVVDDGSTDKSSAICDLYATKDQRIKVIHKENGGLVSARKAGLKITVGDYVGYVDGDDYIDRHFYEKLYNQIVNADADVAISGYSRVLFNKTTNLTNNVKLGVYEGKTLRDVLDLYISNGEFYKNGISTYLWNKLFRRDVLTDYQMSVLDDISIGEDAAVVYPLLANCRKIVVSDDTDYYYRQRADSMLKSSNPFSLEAVGLKKLYNYLIGHIKGKDKQIIDFILSQYIIRSGGFIDEFSLYEKQFCGRDIVVYSAGTFGQQLVKRLSERGYCNIVGWIDEDFWEYRRCCLNVDGIDALKKKRYDYILLATVDGSLARLYKNKLTDFGVPSKKILSISCPESERRDIISYYIKDTRNG